MPRVLSVVTPDQEKCAIFGRYHRMAMTLAWKYHMKFRRPLSECQDEALSALAEVVAKWHTFDRKKSQEQSWVYQCVQWNLLNHCLKESKARTVPIVEGFDQAAPEPTGWVGALLEELGAEGRRLVQVILEAPGVLRYELQLDRKGEALQRPIKGKAAIKRHLERNEGWSGRKIKRAWSEVRRTLQVVS